MSYVLGLDSSTQSLSAVVIDPAAGSIIVEQSVSFGGDLPHYGQPSGFIPNLPDGEVHSSPLMWLEALDLLLSQLDRSVLAKVTALSGSGQQHGSVYLNDRFTDSLNSLKPEKSLTEQLSPALSRETSPIWMDTSTTTECTEIAEAVGGNDRVCQKSGSAAIERFTGPQIRKFAKQEPQKWENTWQVQLVSSFLCSVFAGKPAPIDSGDGAGMNLLNLATQQWDDELLSATAPRLHEVLPPVESSLTSVGPVAPYFVEKFGFSSECEVVLWSGDNPCSLVGMGASQVGRAVVSLGTSDTFFAAMPEAKTDPNQYGHVFGNPVGGYMSLICFLNGSLARERVKDELGLDWSDFDSSGLSRTPVGNGGRLLLPFYGNEITPRLQSDGPIFSANWTEEELSDPAKIVRATLEGQFLNMKVQSAWMELDFEEVLVTGGASQSDGICQVLANVFGCRVSRLQTTGSAALGAAVKAAFVTEDIKISSLEQRFCKVGDTIHPEPAATAVYEPLLREFSSLLESALGSE